jgi:hypothetical protein
MAAPDNTKPGFLSNLTPWASRSTTPVPKPPQAEEGADKDKDKEREKEKEKEKERTAAVLASQQGGDHVVDRRHRLSLRRYPADCPPLDVRWFHAIDVSSQYTSGHVDEHRAMCSSIIHRTQFPCSMLMSWPDAKEETALAACHGPRHSTTKA